MNLSPFALVPGTNRVWDRLRERRAAWSLKDLNVSMKQLIEQRKTRSGVPSNDDLLERLPHARDPETGHGLSARDVRDEMVTIFIAGHETTTLALCWT